MRAIVLVALLLPFLVSGSLACGGEEVEVPTMAAPTQVVEAEATTEPEMATEEPSEETQKATEPPPTAQPTDTPASTEPAHSPEQETTPTAAPEATSTPQPTPEPEDTPTPEDTPVPAATEAPEPTTAGPVAGPDSFLVGEGSKITFTVEEETTFAPVRFDAVVSGTGLTGFANLDGSPSVIFLDLHTLESDQGFRDRYIRQRMFPTTPTATVTVERLPDLPQSLFDGEQTEGMLDGSLQIGETVTPLTFDVVARHDGRVINVLGKTTFTWDELGLASPVFGPVTYLADEVRVQVLIVAREP